MPDNYHQSVPAFSLLILGLKPLQYGRYFQHRPEMVEGGHRVPDMAQVVLGHHW